jgi:hypothetical protein
LVLGLGTYLRFTTPGGAQAINFLQTTYNGSLAALNAAWNISAGSWGTVVDHLADPGINYTAFGEVNGNFTGYVVAARYFSVISQAIRAVDPNHLLLGVRFAVNSPQIVEAAAPWIDVFDQHDYSNSPPLAWLQQIHEITGKPVVVGEFRWVLCALPPPESHVGGTTAHRHGTAALCPVAYPARIHFCFHQSPALRLLPRSVLPRHVRCCVCSFTALDSNLPNTAGARAFNPCTTQTQRANMYTAYAQALLAQPYIVGYGWWQYADEASGSSGTGRVSYKRQPLSRGRLSVAQSHEFVPAPAFLPRLPVGADVRGPLAGRRGQQLRHCQPGGRHVLHLD